MLVRPSRMATVRADVVGHERIVGHRHDRRADLAVDPPEELEDLGRGGAVELAGRLVGEQDGRRVGQGDRDRDALLLAARQVARPVPGPVGQADELEQLLRPLLPIGARRSRTIGSSTLAIASRWGSRLRDVCCQTMPTVRRR